MTEETQKLDGFGCRGATIKVAAGHYVDLSNPDPKTIELGSIGSALSKICRFGGHCPMFYSVAEHCVHAAHLAAREGYQNGALRAILMHDAAEAYIGDMVRPLKNLIPAFREAEDRFLAAIGERFQIDFDAWRPAIEHFDRAMLKAEKIALWPEDAEEWNGFADIKTHHVQFAFNKPALAALAFKMTALQLGLFDFKV